MSKHIVKTLEPGERFVAHYSMASAVGRGTSNKDLTVETCFDGDAIAWVHFCVRNDKIDTWFATYNEAVEKYNSLP